MKTKTIIQGGLTLSGWNEEDTEFYSADDVNEYRSIHWLLLRAPWFGLGWG
jgi:hypothetical protein